MGGHLRVCQPLMVPDAPLPCQSEKGGSKDSDNNTSVENSTMLSASAGAPGGLPSENSPQTRSDINATGTGISDATRSPSAGHLRQFYAS